MEKTATRRYALRLFAGAPLLLAADRCALARDASIGGLIQQSRSLPLVSQRIDFISRSLLGAKYQADTLVGGPRQKEEFVVRLDAFDCVTFCELVLAAAIAHDLGTFEDALRRIRYEHGEVEWSDRNHYFAEWSRRAVENGICRPVRMAPSVAIDKIVDWKNQGRRQVSMLAIPSATFMANTQQLMSGDVIGFVSMRPYLDFYHTGFVTFGAKGELLLRHASQSRLRTLDERMQTFLAVNGVKYVTLLRTADDAPSADRA